MSAAGSGYWHAYVENMDAHRDLSGPKKRQWRATGSEWSHTACKTRPYVRAVAWPSVDGREWTLDYAGCDNAERPTIK